MNLKYRPFAAIGITVLLTLFLIIFVSEKFAPIFLCTGAFASIVALLFRNILERLVPLYIAGSVLFSGLVYYAASTDVKYAEQFIGKTVNVSGEVTDSPTYSNYRYYYILDLKEIDGKSVNSKIRLSLPNELDVEVFDDISLNVSIYEISSDSRDVKLYYHSKGVFLGAYSYNSEDTVIQVKKDDSHRITKNILKFKNLIVGNISDNIPGEKGATVTAMLLGDKSGLADKRNESFREAGVAPIFAVSGLHLSIWVLGLFDLLKSFGVKKRLNSIVSILFTVFFMILTGLTPSVCRSGIMMILLLIGNVFYRKADSVNSLGFVAFVLCTLNPYIAVDTGFLLSFSATFGIVTLVPLCEKYIFSKFAESWFGSTLKSILAPIAVSVSASIAVLPFTILMIGQVSVLAVLSNLLLSYVATACMVVGGFGSLLNGIPLVSDVLFSVAGLLSGILLKTVDFLCDFPITLISTENMFWKIGALVAIAIPIFAVANFSGKNIFRCICIAMSANVLVFSLASYFYFDGLTQLRILNVGEGISVVAYSGGEKIVLTGEADSYAKRYSIIENLEYYNQNQTDLLLLADKNALNDPSNFQIISSCDFKRIVTPYSNQSIEKFVDTDKLFVEPRASIEVFDDDNVRYVTCESYSLALCNFNDMSVLFLFDSYKKAQIPEEYLNADILVCRGLIPYCISPEAYEKVIVCGEGKIAQSVVEYVTSCEGNVLPMANYKSVLVNIRDDSHKIVVSED